MLQTYKKLSALFCKCTEMTHCQKVLLHPKIKARKNPEVTKLGDPGKFWLKAT